MVDASQAHSFAPATSTTKQDKGASPNTVPRNNKDRAFEHFLARRLHSMVSDACQAGKLGVLVKRSCSKLFAMGAFLHRARLFSVCLTLSPDL